MINSVSQFLHHLEAEFEKRKEANEMYSLRAYAKFLDVNPSVLSKIFRGLHKPSPKYILSFGRKLGIPLQDLEKLCKIEEVKKLLSDNESIKNYKEVTMTSYEVVSQWYHFALLYLQDVDSILPDSSELSQRLEVPEDKIIDALKRLEALGIIKNTNIGYEVVSNNLYKNLDNEHLRDASLNFVRDITAKSLASLETTPRALRENTTLLMSFYPERMEDAKQLINSFKSTFLSTFDEKNSANESYAFQISFFPLSHQVLDDEGSDDEDDQ